MGDHTAFFYGTLMAPGVLHRVIHGTHDPEPWQKSMLTVRPALLQGYRRHRVRHADYPAIVPRDSEEINNSSTSSPSAPSSSWCVRGTVVSGLTEGDLYRLDIFEGDQYSRQKVKVQVLKDVELDQAASATTATTTTTTTAAAAAASSSPEIVEEVEAETYVWQEGMETLEPEEWDFEEFKREKMRAWMGLVDQSSTQVDEGFADVDRAVAEEEEKRSQQRTSHDPMGGRGLNGHITQQLKNAAV
ncbi:hypothetical protein ABEF95_015853 [Exophiala dermatitidis]